MNLESYILLFISVGIIITATTSLGLAAEPSVEVSITDVGWNEVVSSTGTIAIGGIAINVTNNSPTKFKNYHICSQLNFNTTTSSDVVCTHTGTLSPSSQTSFTKDGLPINFVNHVKVSELNTIAFDAISESQLAVNVIKDKNVVINSDEVTITFENILNDGTVNISAVDADDVSKTIDRIEETNQLVVSVDGTDMTSVSTVVEINTTTEHTGEILIVIPYDETLLPSGLSESEIRLLRFASGAWVDVTSSIDTSANTVTGSVPGFSQFMAAAPSAASTPSTPSASPSAGKSGGGGSFGSAGGGGGGAYSSTIVLFEVHLYQVSWNTCNNNIMTVIAGPPSGGLGVKLRTAKSGLVTVTLAEHQPYITKSVFEGQIEPTESFVMVQVEAISGRGAQIVQEYIDIKECFGTIIFEKEPSVPVSPTTPSAPTPSMSIYVPFHTMAPKISEGVTFETSYNDANFEINGERDTGIIKEMYVEGGASKPALLETSVVPESTLLTVSILLITLVSVIVVTKLKTLQENQQIKRKEKETR